MRVEHFEYRLENGLKSLYNGFKTLKKIQPELTSFVFSCRMHGSKFKKCRLKNRKARVFTRNLPQNNFFDSKCQSHFFSRDKLSTSHAKDIKTDVFSGPGHFRHQSGSWFF